MTSTTIDTPSSLVFGFRWSLVGVGIALFYVAGCDLFVPPEQSTPRYNSVSGEKRRPQFNPGGAAYQPPRAAASRVAEMDAAYGAGEVTEASATLTTPAAPLIQRPAPQPRAEAPAIMSARPEAAPRAAQAERSFWDRLAFWRSDEPPVQEAPASARRMPEENQRMNATEQAASTPPVEAAELAPVIPPAPEAPKPREMAASAYPVLADTPERPSVAAVDNTRQRLAAESTQMEADRAAARDASAQVVRDAQAEPSLLSTQPQATAAPAPAQPLPALLPPPVINGVRMTPGDVVAERSVPAENRSLSSVPDKAPVVAPPPAVASVAPPAPAAPALEPIRLTPPPGVLADAPMAAPPVLAQDEGASIRLQAPRAYAGREGFLPQSRYNTRRLQ